MASLAGTTLVWQGSALDRIWSLNSARSQRTCTVWQSSMGTSSNFGNMFSMAAASLFLPFLPMLPSQILLNNFLYDVSQVSIPSDNVDPAMVQRPKRWQIGFIRQFMTIIGPISSIYDFLTFVVLLWVFHASTNESLFHTGWFVESLATQTLSLLAAIAVLAVTYLFLVQAVKSWFYRRHALL
jgi:magnesium-transporting ATPase (P-type)